MIVELTLHGGLLQGLYELKEGQQKEIMFPIITRNPDTGTDSRGLLVFKDSGYSNPVSHNRIYNCIGIEI